MSLERLKIQSSNFARGLKVRAAQSKNEKILKKRLWPRSHNLLFKCWDSANISGKA